MSLPDSILDKLAQRFDIRFCPCCGAETPTPMQHCACRYCRQTPNNCMACGHAIGNTFSRDDHDVQANLGLLDCPVRYTVTEPQEREAPDAPATTA